MRPPEKMKNGKCRSKKKRIQALFAYCSTDAIKHAVISLFFSDSFNGLIRTPTVTAFSLTTEGLDISMLFYQEEYLHHLNLEVILLRQLTQDLGK